MEDAQEEGERNVTDQSNEEGLVDQTAEDDIHGDDSTKFEVLFDAGTEHDTEHPTQGEEDHSLPVGTDTEVPDPSHETHADDTTEEENVLTVDEINNMGDTSNPAEDPSEDVGNQRYLDDNIVGSPSKGDLALEITSQTDHATLYTAPDKLDSGRSINLTTEHGLDNEWHQISTPPALFMENEDTLQTKDVSPCILVYT